MCPDCRQDHGLCRAHADGDKSILPQLAVNRGWLRMIAAAATPSAPSPDELEAQRALQAAAYRRNRFARALEGKHTRVRRSA